MASEQNLPLPSELRDLSAFIDTRAECLATANSELHTIALCAAKFVFDWALQTETASKPHIERLLATLTETAPPQTRSQTRSSSKRKRSPSPVEKPQKKVSVQETPLSSLFVDGMSSEQVWEQLDLRAARVCQIANVLDGDEADGLEGEEGEGSEGEGDEEDDEEAMELGGQDGEEESSDGDEDDASITEDEGVMELREETSDEDGEDDDGDEPPSSMFDVVRRNHKSGPAKAKRRGRSELDDGFFDLAAFNAETEEAEAKSVSKGKLNRSVDDEDSEEDEEDVDLFGPVDNMETFDEDDLEDGGGELFYRDFFDAPRSTKPPKKCTPLKSSKVRFNEQVKVKKIKAVGKGMPVSSMDDDDSDEEEEMEGINGLEEMDDGDGDDDDDEMAHSEDDEMEEGLNDGDSENGADWSTIERLKDDLFAEDEEEPQKDMTSHEQRLAAIQAQIQELETENVAKKDWVLMGEASSRSRPHDSLLQEDLDFERATKAVPIVTEEVVLGLEARIKARISEGRFDDVVRKRPVDDKPFLPSRFFELQDTKSTQSLAQIYEGDYLAAQTGTSSDDRDGKLKKEHEEITKLWDGICNKLDALCNAHYVPKQPKASISTVSDLPAASLESALPSGKSAASMFAPEEVFAPASSDARSRSELTPAEKRVLRAKERKARKKTRDALEKSVDKYAKMKGGVKQQKEAALKSLVKSGKGVTVVGKQSKVTVKKQRAKA
ncbi:hypothetical protein HYDPIDRAFT_82734 [Hydnomerulius pinastri MD-312]|nr:hypothetical protein HYDPIDRAFT_82734 [Hydnomerulius pinastri MD-312]